MTGLAGGLGGHNQSYNWQGPLGVMVESRGLFSSHGDPGPAPAGRGHHHCHSSCHGIRVIIMIAGESRSSVVTGTGPGTKPPP